MCGILENKIQFQGESSKGRKNDDTKEQRTRHVKISWQVEGRTTDECVMQASKGSRRGTSTTDLPGD